VQVQVKLYPPFSLFAGVRECEVEVDDGASVGAALRQLCQRFPALTALLGPLDDDQLFRRQAIVLLGDDITDLSCKVTPGCRLSLVGPLQGG